MNKAETAFAESLAVGKRKATDALDKVAVEVDGLESLLTALSMPLPAQIHVDCLRATLPHIVKNVRLAVISGGVNPWDTHPNG